MKYRDLIDRLEKDKWHVSGVTCQEAANAIDELSGIAEQLKSERDAALAALRMEETISFRCQMQEYAAQRDKLLVAAKKAMNECCDLIATPAGDALASAISNVKD